MSSTIRAAKSDGSAVWTLLAISFAYGIFHAAGPGHGKAVISSYLVANEETAQRGIALSFASALMQALVAVAIVGVSAWLLNATAKTMCGAERAIEIASYALIAGFGARLVWTKGGGFFRALQARRPAPAMAMAAHMITIIIMITAITITRMRTTGHVHDEHCGHSHGPTPDQLAGPGGWRRGFGAIFAVGIRPCSGAILVLVFALAQGLFWAGVAATFVMGLGTAITVATIAVIAVSERIGAAPECGPRRRRRAGDARRGIRRGGTGAAVRAGVAAGLHRRGTGDVFLKFVSRARCSAQLLRSAASQNRDPVSTGREQPGPRLCSAPHREELRAALLPGNARWFKPAATPGSTAEKISPH